MPDFLRHLTARIVIWHGDADSYGTGNIVDLPARYVLASPGPAQTEERVDMADGTTRATRRRHTVQVPISESEAAEFAALMGRQQDCPVQAVFLGVDGAESWCWYEPARIALSDRGTPALQMGERTLTMETSIFDAAIWRGRDLLAGIPWAGLDATATRAPTALADPLPSVSGILDLAHDGTDTYGVTADTLWNLSQSTSAALPTSAAVGVAYGGMDFIVLDTAGPTVEVVQSDGTSVSSDPYPGTTPGPAAYQGGTTYVCDTGAGEVQVLDASFADAGTITPQSGGTPEQVTVWTDAGGTTFLIFRTDTPAVEVWDLSGASPAFVRQITDEARPWAGWTYASGVLEVHSTGLSARRQVTIWALEPRKALGYEGPAWRVPGTARVDIGGVASGLSASPARLEAPLPVPGATLRLEAEAAITGTLTMRDWDGVTVAEAAEDTDLVVDGALAPIGGDVVAWYADVVVENAAARPRLAVVAPGAGLGARPGGVTDSCADRVSRPAWAPSYTSFTVQASAGDILRVTADGSTSSDLDVLISQSGATVSEDALTLGVAESIPLPVGTSEVYIRADPDFSGVTDLVIEGPTVAGSLDFTGVLSLKNLEVRRITGDTAPTGTTTPAICPEGIATFFLFQPVTTAFADIAATVSELRYDGCTIIDDISALVPRPATLNVNNCSMNAGSPASPVTVRAEDVADQPVRLDSLGTQDLQYDLDSLATADLSALTFLRAAALTGDMRAFLLAARAIERYDKTAGATGTADDPTVPDLDGTGLDPDSNTVPILPPAIQDLTYRNVGGNKTFDTWEGLSSLNLILISAELDSEAVPNINASLDAFATAIGAGNATPPASAEVRMAPLGDRTPSNFNDVRFAVTYVTHDALAAHITVAYARRTRPIEVISITSTTIVANDPAQDLVVSVNSGNKAGLVDTGAADGLYLIDSISHNAGTGETTITTSEAIPGATLGAEASTFVHQQPDSTV